MPRNYRRLFLLLGLSLQVLVFPGSAGAQVGNRPAATLLYPYFEVDLDDPAGRSTQLSVQNTSGAPALAHAVVWTNCGFAVLDFTLYLEANSLVPLDLRRVIAGRVPSTGPETGGLLPFPGCSNPLQTPQLDEAAAAALARRLSGRPEPENDLCYGVGEATSRTAVGYVTVDVVKDCSDELHTPYDPGYFSGDDGPGLASAANILTGELLLIDRSGGHAQGIEAVPVLALPGDFVGASFYDHGDDRVVLPARFRTRLLQGGAFTGGTRLLLWTRNSRSSEVSEVCPGCDVCSSCGDRTFLYTAMRNEQGELYGQSLGTMEANVVDLRYGFVDSALRSFGTVDVQFFYNCPICSPPQGPPVQGWVIPIYSAEGHFSVGLNAVQLPPVIW